MPVVRDWKRKPHAGAKSSVRFILCCSYCLQQGCAGSYRLVWAANGRVLYSATWVHELGHTFGLVHCDDGRCVMRRSTNLAGVDTKSAAFCPDCRVRLREALVLTENDS